MAFAEQMDFRRPESTISIDRKSSFFEDGYDGLESSTMSPTFSAENFGFDDFPSNTFVDRTLATNNPFLEQSNNPYRHAMPVQHQQSWPMAETPSGSRTPTTSTTTYNPFGTDFDSNAPVQFNQPGFHGMTVDTNVRPSSIFTPTPMDPIQTPMSPHSNKEWMEMSQQMDGRGGPKRMRPSSPSRPFSPFRQNDGGIRKKNARFEIPRERTLNTIDDLISSCNDPNELKELKQQKRLLRNRQAALDSRQRKKKHTEDLEEEKKVWNDRMTDMESELHSLRLNCQQISQERDFLRRQMGEAQQIAEVLQMEKEELVRSHTLETGELRKKNSILIERLEAAAAAGPMSVAPSQTSFADFATDMDNLNMGTADWDNYIFVDEFASENAQQQQQQAGLQHNNETQLVVSHRTKDVAANSDKSGASGLLLMLLLCGAFVASKSSGTTAPPLPRMPDDIRAASATVLDSILKDANVAPSAAQNFVANRVDSLSGPSPSGAAWPKPDNFAFSAGSDLDQKYHQLTAPSKDQEAEAAFGMTASQYNGLTSMDFTRRVYSIHDDSPGTSPGSRPSSHRRNLAEQLAAMRAESKGDGVAEVYTRSLLWDRIPSDIVRDFKRMVEEGERLTSSTPASEAATCD